MSAPIDDGGPAFPLPPGVTWNQSGGMSIRDVFAGQAMAALISDPDNFDVAFMGGLTAHRAYLMADAMLAERKRGGAS